MKFRKKPVVIEAIRFDGENEYEICRWAHSELAPESNRDCADMRGRLEKERRRAEAYREVAKDVVKAKGILWGRILSDEAWFIHVDAEAQKIMEERVKSETLEK